MGLILNLVPNKKKLHLSMKIGATRLSNCKVGKLLCNFQSSKSLQTKGKPAGVKQHQLQVVFAKISYGETLLINLFASNCSAECQRFVLEAAFLRGCNQMPSVAVEHRLPLCDLPSLIPRMTFKIRKR